LLQDFDTDGLPVWAHRDKTLRELCTRDVNFRSEVLQARKEQTRVMLRARARALVATEAARAKLDQS
jgi:hypothetical protein